MANLNRQLREMLLVIERNTTRAIWRQLEKDWQYHRKHPKGEVPPLYTYVTDIISHAMHGDLGELGNMLTIPELVGECLINSQLEPGEHYLNSPCKHCSVLVPIKCKLNGGSEQIFNECPACHHKRY